MAEVRRLEDVRYQQMVDLVLAKGAELAAMCTDSHVAQPPGLSEALAAIDSNDRNPGAAAELLSKLLHMLAEVQVWLFVPAGATTPAIVACCLAVDDVSLLQCLQCVALQASWQACASPFTACHAVQYKPTKPAHVHGLSDGHCSAKTEPAVLLSSARFCLQVLTGKRASIIAAVNEVEAARQEDVWLAAYEADDQRYKVGGGGAGAETA
jgi:hypothetical protein